MHQVHNLEHRQARDKAIHKRFGNIEDVVNVDATDYSGRYAMALGVLSRQGKSITCGSVRTSEPEVGEEAVIALVVAASVKIKYKVSHTKSAIISYARGRSSLETSAILRTGPHNIQRSGKIYLV